MENLTEAGMTLPFSYSVENYDGGLVYADAGWDAKVAGKVYSTLLLAENNFFRPYKSRSIFLTDRVFC